MIEKNAQEDVDYDCLNKHTILIFSFLFYLLSKNEYNNQFQYIHIQNLHLNLKNNFRYIYFAHKYFPVFFCKTINIFYHVTVHLTLKKLITKIRLDKFLDIFEFLIR